MARRCDGLAAGIKALFYSKKACLSLRCCCLGGQVWKAALEKADAVVYPNPRPTSSRWHNAFRKIQVRLPGHCRDVFVLLRPRPLIKKVGVSIENETSRLINSACPNPAVSSAASHHGGLPAALPAGHLARQPPDGRRLPRSPRPPCRHAPPPSPAHISPCSTFESLPVADPGGAGMGWEEVAEWQRRWGRAEKQA